MKYKIAAIIVLIAIAIQFIPYGKEHMNSAVVAEPEWDSLRTKELFARACADCHSNETQWPWYSNVAPVSWLVQHDVNEGREHLNVSMWGAQKKNKGDEAVKEVREDEMPPWFYVIAHPEAKLSVGERELFLQGLEASFGDGKEKDE